MKDRIIQLALSFVLTFGGLFCAFSQSIETPPFVGERIALFSVITLNTLWLIPCLIIYWRKRTFRKAASALVVYLLPVVTVMLYVGYYHRPFDSKKWQTDLSATDMIHAPANPANPTPELGTVELPDEQHYNNYPTHLYPAHLHGEMVTSFLNSKAAIGLSGQELDALLGTSYYIEKRGEDTARYYYYDTANIFDGCDKIYVRLHEGHCIEAFHAGCD
ncbi:MAG: hypothetical protein ACRYFX_00315 [Janthinobacterium lividum]